MTFSGTLKIPCKCVTLTQVDSKYMIEIDLTKLTLKDSSKWPLKVTLSDGKDTTEYPFNLVLRYAEVSAFSAPNAFGGGSGSTTIDTTTTRAEGSTTTNTMDPTASGGTSDGRSDLSATGARGNDYSSDMG